MSEEIKLKAYPAALDVIHWILFQNFKAIVYNL